MNGCFLAIKFLGKKRAYKPRKQGIERFCMCSKRIDDVCIRSKNIVSAQLSAFFACICPTHIYTFGLYFQNNA